MEVLDVDVIELFNRINRLDFGELNEFLKIIK
jgi:hypothetical protein